MKTSFQNALLELLKGRKIRNCDWNEDTYVVLEKGTLRDNHNHPCDLNISEEGSLRYCLAYMWEVLPTTEELLILKGKAYDIGNFCNNFSEVCENCPVYATCNAVKGGDYFVDVLTDDDFKADMWFRNNMDKINEMWEKLFNEK